MNNRFSHLTIKLNEIQTSENPSTEEMQKQIKTLSSMLEEVMFFLNKDLSTTLQNEIQKKHDIRS